MLHSAAASQANLLNNVQIIGSVAGHTECEDDVLLTLYDALLGSMHATYIYIYCS